MVWTNVEPVQVKTNAMVAEKILGAEFKMHHDRHGNRLLRAHGRVSGRSIFSSFRSTTARCTDKL